MEASSEPQGAGTSWSKASPLTRLVPMAPLWKKGQSGNRSGKSKEENGFRRRARQLTLKDLERIGKASAKLEAMIEAATDPDVVVKLDAALRENYQLLAISGFGRTPERVEVEDDEPQLPTSAAAILAGIERRRQQENAPVDVTVGRVEENT